MLVQNRLLSRSQNRRCPHSQSFQPQAMSSWQRLTTANQWSRTHLIAFTAQIGFMKTLMYTVCYPSFRSQQQKHLSSPLSALHHCLITP